MSNKKLLSGQGLLEYVLLLVFIAVVVMVALQVFGPRLGAVFSSINTQLASI
jgi:Flp pilus assembly pilin Flp